MGGRFSLMTDEGDHVIFDSEAERVVSRGLDILTGLHKVGLMNEPYPQLHLVEGRCERCTRPPHDGLTCKEQEARLPFVRRRHMAHQPDATDLPEPMFDAYCGIPSAEQNEEYERITL